MIDLNKNFKKQVMSVCCGIFAVAFVLSAGTKVLAQTAENSAPAAEKTVKVSGGTGLDRVIEGTENWGEEHNINPVQFLKNIGKSTGIYKMFFQSAQEAEAEEAAKALAEENAEKAGATNWGRAPGWQSFLMMCIGFLIIYLGAGKGFEPLLLIPIGMGTVLINAVGGVKQAQKYKVDKMQVQFHFYDEKDQIILLENLFNYINYL